MSGDANASEKLIARANAEQRFREHLEARRLRDLAVVLSLNPKQSP